VHRIVISILGRSTLYEEQQLPLAINSTQKGMFLVKTFICGMSVFLKVLGLVRSYLQLVQWGPQGGSICNGIDCCNSSQTLLTVEMGVMSQDDSFRDHLCHLCQHMSTDNANRKYDHAYPSFYGPQTFNHSPSTRAALNESSANTMCVNLTGHFRPLVSFGREVTTL